MEYKTYKVKEKPNKAPKEFCVYEYNNEEYENVRKGGK